MQVVGINKLLSDIYKRDMRLSYLLTELDFCSKEIELINRKLLPNTVACFLNTIEKATRPRIAEMPKGKRIKTAIADVWDGVRQFKIIEDIYGLTGDRSKTLRQVGTELNISHERVRQLNKKIIRRLVLNLDEFSWKFEFEKETRQLLEKYRDCATLDLENSNSPPKYDFDLSVLSTGEKCLIISERKNKIIIAEPDFEDFYNSLIKHLGLSKSPYLNSHNIEEIRKIYSRAYEKWTREEENWLKNYLIEGLTIQEIAEMLERQPGAISSRIAKLNLR